MTARTSEQIAAAMYGSPADVAPAQPSAVGHAPAQAPVGNARSADQLAAAMYKSDPRPEATAPAAPAAQVRKSDQIAAALYPTDTEVPEINASHDEDIKALRQDPLHGRYTADIDRAIPANEFDSHVGKEAAGMKITPEAAKKAVGELRAAAADLSLGQDEIQAVKLGIARCKELVGNQEKTIASRDSAVDLLNNAHGNEAALALRCARAYVAKNPKLTTLLEQTRVGDHPQTVALIAAKALALHKAGKLRLPK